MNSYFSGPVPEILKPKQFRCIEDAVAQGKADYADLPMAFTSENTAIKYRVAQFIWEQLYGVDTSEPADVLNAIATIVK